MKWLLTSTLRDLRDHATHAIYWYGRGDPKALFELTLSSLNANDPYVLDRLLAATYGVVMAAPAEQRALGDDLAKLLKELWLAFCSEEATSPTYHWMIRDYVYGIVRVVSRYYPSNLGPWANDPDFHSPCWPEPIGRNDIRLNDKDLIYGLDFANYTLGRLVPDRQNYDYHHAVFQEVLSWIRGRVWELGWRHERFNSIEHRMRGLDRHSEHKPGRLELYLKKYGWIAFYEAAGRLEVEERSPLRPDEFRLSDADIDPSFPAIPSTLSAVDLEWLSDSVNDLRLWVQEGQVDVPDELLCRRLLEDETEPWYALSGHLVQESLEMCQRVFGSVHAILVQREDVDRLKNTLHARRYPGNHWIPGAPEDHYLFAGEATWSSHARRNHRPDQLQQLYSGTIVESNGNEIPVEIPVHRYGWESYHSTLNEAGGHFIPATTIADVFDLRVVPGSLDWCEPDGRLASVTVRAPASFKYGHLLYGRSDLIREYCDMYDYELVWIVWGERQPWLDDKGTQQANWAFEALAEYANVWRRVATIADFQST